MGGVARARRGRPGSRRHAALAALSRRDAGARGGHGSGETTARCLFSTRPCLCRGLESLAATLPCGCRVSRRLPVGVDRGRLPSCSSVWPVRHPPGRARWRPSASSSRPSSRARPPTPAGCASAGRPGPRTLRDGGLTATACVSAPPPPSRASSSPAHSDRARRYRPECAGHGGGLPRSWRSSGGDLLARRDGSRRRCSRSLVVCLVLGSLGTIAGSPPLPPPPHAH